MCGHNGYHKNALANWLLQCKKNWLQNRIVKKLGLDARQSEYFQQLFDVAMNIRHNSRAVIGQSLNDILKLDGVDKTGLRSILDEVTREQRSCAEQLMEKFSVFYDELTNEQRTIVKSYIGNMQRRCAY